MKWFLTEVRYWAMIAIAVLALSEAARMGNQTYVLEKTEAQMSYQYLQMAQFKFRAQYPPTSKKPIAYQCYE